jgi:RNA polymerase sigma-70 factor, ECF subfamily
MPPALARTVLPAFEAMDYFELDSLDDVACPAPPRPAAARPGLAFDAALRARAVDPDADVLALVDRGDAQGALRRLMQRHGGALYRFCRGATHDAALADDVLQQIFIEVHRDLAGFRRQSTLRTWIFVIARHRVLDAAKSRRRARAWLERAPPAELADPRPSPPEILDEAQLQAALIACLGELDGDLRTALLLRFQQGFSYEEMAAVCGEKAGTLHARVTRALPALRARIEHRLGRDGATRPRPRGIIARR